jgi:hypothetical protein
VVTLWIPVHISFLTVFPKNFIYPTPDAEPCPIGGAKIEYLQYAAMTKDAAQHRSWSAVADYEAVTFDLSRIRLQGEGGGCYFDSIS